MNFTLGSLFDGSGGFPLAGSLCGITPVWASEVEPYPIAVTKCRFPQMKHLGDISKVNGAEIEPVDVITFGSPCQDLSVAGKRAGLKHETNGDQETTRSGLFMEAIRIIKEMRRATNGKHPRFALWENVPGAFSSNKGEDFRLVLEELVKISETKATVPPAPKGGWPYADAYMGDGWSLAYRTFDAQYWGVPQRRRRIYLVADFAGGCAPGILFEREGLRGYFAEGKNPWKKTAAGAQRSFRTDGCKNKNTQISDCVTLADIASTIRAGAGAPKHNQDYIGRLVLFEPRSQDGVPRIHKGVSPTLNTAQGGQRQPCVAVSVKQYPFCKSSRPNFKGDSETYIDCKVSNTLNTFDLGDKRANELIVEDVPVYCVQGNCIDRADTAGCNGKGWNEGACYTLNTIDRPAIAYAVDQGGGKSGANYQLNVSPTLTCTHGGEPAIAYAMTTGRFMQGKVEASPTLAARDYKDPPLVCFGDSAQIYGQNSYAGYAEGVSGTLKASGGSYGGGSESLIVENEHWYIVRRLTPIECARLQGFADEWGLIKNKTDFTDEEYRFWLGVRNTHAVINGRKEKEYTKAQILSWYNRLHSDSSEYKMWGNGVALPPTLYCMQGIGDALSGVTFG